MTAIKSLPACLSLSMLLCACGTDLTLDFSDQVQTSAELGAVIRETQEANNAGDVDAWVGLFDDNFRYLPSNLPAITDRDSLRMIAETGFSAWQTEIIIQPVATEIAGDWAIVDSQVRGRSISTTGTDTVSIDLKQLVVYRMTDRGWRISRLMTNENG